MLELKLIRVCKMGPGQVSFPAEKKNPGEYRNALDYLPLHTTVPLSQLTFPNRVYETHCPEQLNTSQLPSTTVSGQVRDEALLVLSSVDSPHNTQVRRIFLCLFVVDAHVADAHVKSL